jgi:hypothetical protein
MRTALLTTVAAACLAATGAQAFQAAQPLRVNPSTDLECAIVAHTPDRDRNPPYKVSIYLEHNNGVLQTLDVFYTLVNGREVSRTDQYPNGRTWKVEGKADWYWAASRPGLNISGHLYHNQRDGWMYAEQISTPRGGYRMLADCHENPNGHERD